MSTNIMIEAPLEVPTIENMIKVGKALAKENEDFFQFWSMWSHVKMDPSMFILFWKIFLVEPCNCLEFGHKSLLIYKKGIKQPIPENLDSINTLVTMGLDPKKFTDVVGTGKALSLKSPDHYDSWLGWIEKERNPENSLMWDLFLIKEATIQKTSKGIWVNF